MDIVIQNKGDRSVLEAPVTVLAVDDDPSIIRFLQLFLESQGYRLRSAFTGEEGIATAQESVPDIVLLDYVLPDLDGSEVVRRLKADERTRNIPIVVLTARSGVGEKVRSLDLGVDDYITKPFDIQELQARLASVVARRRKQSLATEAEKLKTLRRVVASVSHEVNNPLAAILMCAESLERRHAGTPDVVEKSRLIQENVIRIRDILQRLERVRSVVAKPYVAGERILDLGNEEKEP